MTRIQPMVEKHSQLPAGRLRVVGRFEDLRLTEIRRGIVFVFASWSGPAVVALKRFTRVLSSLDTQLLDLVVIDTDCLAEDAAMQLFGTDGFPSRITSTVASTADALLQGTCLAPKALRAPLIWSAVAK